MLGHLVDFLIDDGLLSLQCLHMSRLCHLTAQTLGGLSALNRLGLWGFSDFPNGLQLWDLTQK